MARKDESKKRWSLFRRKDEDYEEEYSDEYEDEYADEDEEGYEDDYEEEYEDGEYDEEEADADEPAKGELTEGQEPAKAEAADEPEEDEEYAEEDEYDDEEYEDDGYDEEDGEYDERYDENYEPPRFRLNKLQIACIVAIAVMVLGVGADYFIRHSAKSANAVLSPSPKATVEPTDTAAEETAPAETTEPTEAPVSEVTAEPTASAQPAEDFFTTGEVQVGDMSYKSQNLNVQVTKTQENGNTYYVADVRARSAEYLFSAFAKDQYGMHIREGTSVMAKRKGAVVAIDGDYYGYRSEGIVIRNGKVYRNTPFEDVAVIYNDGTMKTMKKGEADADALLAAGAVQAWSFGPMLLDADGKALAEFSAPKVPLANPRAGIGYLEPNHFLLVVVDGRVKDSKGMTQVEFAKLFETLGCKSAYNLDGGGSAVMFFMGKIISQPSDVTGERPISDIVYFGESETDQSTIDRYPQ